MLTGALLLMFAALEPQPASGPADAPRTIRLNVGDPPLPTYRGWTVAQLRAEYIRLDDARPGNALPTVALLTGITGLSVSFFAYAIALGGFRGADTLANISFGLGATVSAGLTAFGIIQLTRSSTPRRVYGAQMEAVERIADGMERDERLLDLWEKRHGPATPPPLLRPPPQGPVPPPSAPPIVPGPPVFPGGRVSLVFPVLFARF